MVTSQTIMKDLGVARIEMVNVDNACAGGSTAVRSLYKDIAAGFVDVGIAIGVESMTTSPVAGRLIPPDKDDLDGQLGLTMPVLFGLQARRLMETHGARREDFARVSVKAHDFGALNPRAQYRKRFTIDEVLGSRMIADPITLLQCCPNTDGAAAVVPASAEVARAHAQMPIRIAGSAPGLRSAGLPARGHHLDGCRCSRGGGRLRAGGRRTLRRRCRRAARCLRQRGDRPLRGLGSVRPRRRGRPAPLWSDFARRSHPGQPQRWPALPRAPAGRVRCAYHLRHHQPAERTLGRRPGAGGARRGGADAWWCGQRHGRRRRVRPRPHPLRVGPWGRPPAAARAAFPQRVRLMSSFMISLVPP
uniref:Thiolase family protein n=1 Tax=Janibacter limosus TaxID=53458 RepID=A0AC61U412_9MICO|nr:thiolase family protein [Janibacter limosus]